jgi:hypothetical protein
VLANVKNSLLAAHCAVAAKHLPRYLGAFAWRFNRRFVLKTIHERLASPPRQPRQCPIACSNWLRLDGKREEFFEIAYASLDAVRVAWRNPTTHVENKYTDDEAEPSLSQ